jgi:4-hydroxythreonine-4-phosphate dehydrogenase
VVPLDVAVTAEPGRPDRSSAPAAVASIRRAVADVIAGSAAAIVTNPVAKNVLYNWGFAEPGHTEFLAKLVQEATGKYAAAGDDAVVAGTRGRAGDDPSAAKEIFKQLSTELVVETGRIVARDLAVRFRLPHPRLAIAGLNPHAGEDGTLGEEDRTIVAPAVARLVAEGIDARGPLPADSLFHERARATYDAALVHVSRPGADPDQDARLRSCRQCHARPSLRAHLARSRHRLRHRRAPAAPTRQA